MGLQFLTPTQRNFYFFRGLIFLWWMAERWPVVTEQLSWTKVTLTVPVDNFKNWTFGLRKFILMDSLWAVEPICSVVSTNPPPPPPPFTPSAPHLYIHKCAYMHTHTHTSTHAQAGKVNMPVYHVYCCVSREWEWLHAVLRCMSWLSSNNLIMPQSDFCSGLCHYWILFEKFCCCLHQSFIRVCEEAT